MELDRELVEEAKGIFDRNMRKAEETNLALVQAMGLMTTDPYRHTDEHAMLSLFQTCMGIMHDTNSAMSALMDRLLYDPNKYQD